MTFTYSNVFDRMNLISSSVTIHLISDFGFGVYEYNLDFQLDSNQSKGIGAGEYVLCQIESCYDGGQVSPGFTFDFQILGSIETSFSPRIRADSKDNVWRIEQDDVPMFMVYIPVAEVSRGWGLSFNASAAEGMRVCNASLFWDRQKELMPPEIPKGVIFSQYLIPRFQYANFGDDVQYNLDLEKERPFNLTERSYDSMLVWILAPLELPYTMGIALESRDYSLVIRNSSIIINGTRFSYESGAFIEFQNAEHLSELSEGKSEKVIWTSKLYLYKCTPVPYHSPPYQAPFPILEVALGLTGLIVCIVFGIVFYQVRKQYFNRRAQVRRYSSARTIVDADSYTIHSKSTVSTLASHFTNNT